MKRRACQHPVLEKGNGIYEFDAEKEWVTRITPYANFIAGVLKTLLPIAAPAVNVFFGAKTTEKWGIEDQLELMKESTDKPSSEIKSLDPPSHMREGMLSEEERSGVLALHALLRELDPNQERLGLKRMPTCTGDFVWLCQKHYDAAQPKIPEKIG